MTSTALTPQAIAAIRSDFEALARDPDGLAAAFYARLFELAPEVRPMFPSDLGVQGGKLVAVLALAVRSLDRLDTILAALRALGSRHEAYGVEPRHYDLVGAALLDTLARRLGGAFTPDAQAAWACAYTVLADVMLAAGTPAAPAPLAA